MTRSRAALLSYLFLVFGLAVLRVGPARAQTVSPGPLSRDHAHLEGIRNCTQCHELGQRVIDATKCLACHAPLKSRIDARRGYHASSAVAGRACEECHHEHAGREMPLVNWGGAEASFDHALAGWPLAGGHRKVPCATCHDPRRIRAPELREQLARTPGARTFLGLDTGCVSCHFDEHRGQLAADCATCHGVDAWKPAPRFDHDRTAYPLKGSHRQVACARCHAGTTDPAYSATAFPPARAAAFLKFKPVEHGECSACHKDPHAGRLGGACASCHSVDAWKRVAARTAEAAFHDKTRFPLAGRHRDVPCANCHPAAAGGKMEMTGFAFARCADCHEDAHAGQIAAPAASDCARCHSADGFAPARFTLEDHAATRYPLLGGHQAVPCAACHPPDRTLDKPGWRRPPRVFRADPGRLSYGDLRLDDCATCHPDPHAGQFAAAAGAAPESSAGRGGRACADCHRVASFRDLAFDHARDTGYPLRGRHAATPCGSCHPARDRSAPPARATAPWFAPAAGAPGTVQVALYRGTARACEACHADPHLGQFARAGRTACADCHTEEAFKPATKFDHARSRFALTGAHVRARCEGCHRPVPVLSGRATTLYRPVPAACAGCHEDFHGGAFRVSGRALECGSCHGTATWRQVAFNHDQTGFKLGVAHAGVACASCHKADITRPPARQCAGCHEDPHGGALGSSCGECHLDAATFRNAGAAAFHERTRLPLLGRHAAIPCASCHVDRGSSTWTGLDARCESCHSADFDRTASLGIDHRAWGFSTRCDDCHDTYRWDLATFPRHEGCFPIRTGPHSGVACLSCHTSVTPNPTPGCATMTAACTHCHLCASMNGRHASVPGYECRDRKCYECHPSGRGD